MKKHCENRPCPNEAVTEVSVSVTKASDQKRSLCAACQEVYAWGVQHGRMIRRRKKVWVLAIADRGMVVEGRVFNRQRQAFQGLANYLKVHEDYDGGTDRAEIGQWLAEHDERLAAEIFPSSLELD